MGKFEQILRERLGNILKESFNHKNSEIVRYPLSTQSANILKKMISFGNAASSHSGLISLKTAYSIVSIKGNCNLWPISSWLTIEQIQLVTF